MPLFYNSPASPHTFRGKSVKLPTRLIKTTPVQVVGFVPVSDISVEDCRTPPDCEYINQVFAKVGDSDVTHNDKNSFLFRFATGLTSPTIEFFLDKWTGAAWSEVIALVDNTRGTYYGYNTIPGHSNYAGFQMDWQEVISFHGAATYAFRLHSNIFGSNKSYRSEPFRLREWTCDLTDCTVRFEATIKGGSVGSIDNDKESFSFCGTTAIPFSWYDSIRVPGFFGNESSEFQEDKVEYPNGNVSDVRSKLINKFKFIPDFLPKYLHDRLKMYGFVAGKQLNNELLVTDYNVNNLDWAISRKSVALAGGFEPTYNKFSNDKASVVVDFEERNQNTTAGKCC